MQSKLKEKSASISRLVQSTSAPIAAGPLAPDVIIITRLAVLVDVIAIAAGIAVILPPADDCSENAAEHRAGNGAADRTNAWKNRTGDSATGRADSSAGRNAPTLAVVIIAVVVAVVVPVRAVPIRA